MSYGLYDRRVFLGAIGPGRASVLSDIKIFITVKYENGTIIHDNKDSFYTKQHYCVSLKS